MEDMSEREDVAILGFDLPSGQVQAEVTQVEEEQEQLPPPHTQSNCPGRSFIRHRAADRANPEDLPVR